jgi:hypothetical protein
MSHRIETGSCFCGAITAQLEGEPFWINYDHDDDCRKAIGSPLAIWIGYRKDQFRLTKGTPRTYSRTAGVVRTFCPNCGTSISYMDEGLADDIYLTIGFMDAPEHFEPMLHAYWREKLPWLRFEDDLPRVDGYSRDRDTAHGNPNER